MATPVLNYISEQDYLEAERKAFEKHEYYKGEIFAMSGASLRHNKIFSINTVDLKITLSDIYEGVKFD